MASDETLKLKIDFKGGAELLFGNVRTHHVTIPAKAPATASSSKPEGRRTDITYLIDWMRVHMLKEREELFIDGESVRPGILILINDTDWELEGEGDYVIQSGDQIVFISTLHGG